MSLFIRTVDTDRARLKVGMANMAYNSSGSGKQAAATWATETANTLSLSTLRPKIGIRARIFDLSFSHKDRLAVMLTKLTVLRGVQVLSAGGPAYIHDSLLADCPN